MPGSRLLGEARAPGRRGSPQFRHQRFDSDFRTRPHLAGLASTSLSSTCRNGPPQACRHRAAAGARTDMLFDHSLVLAPDETLAFEVAGYGPVGLVLDGREVGRLAEGDTVTCTESPRAARLITFRPRDFHQVLKAKFGLAERPSPRGLPQDRDGDPDGY